MDKRKICLFTAHSPQTGGGGVILRSLIKNLPDISVSWYYIDDKVIEGYEKGYLGAAIMGGGFMKDILLTRKMLSNGKISLIDNLVQQLTEIECDEYWIVSHNEGIRVAIEMVQRQTRPVHLTVHDDWAGALCARSIRYRFMSGLAKKMTVQALKAVSSFDVISIGMRDYYQQLSGKKGELCHRYLPPDTIRQDALLNHSGHEKITVGHIGSIYDKDDFIAFLSIFVEFALSKGKKPKLQMWGCHLTINDVPAELRGSVQFFATLPEEKVVPELLKCAFVYSMYPLNEALRVFSKTSLPTKLTSYLQAGRPILGHAPSDSTLSEFLASTGLGVLWSSRNKDKGLKALEKIFELNVSGNQFEDARARYFGEENLKSMRRVLNVKSQDKFIRAFSDKA